MDWVKRYVFIHEEFMLIHVDFDRLYDRKADIWVLIGQFHSDTASISCIILLYIHNDNDNDNGMETPN